MTKNWLIDCFRFYAASAIFQSCAWPKIFILELLLDWYDILIVDNADRQVTSPFKFHSLLFPLLEFPPPQETQNKSYQQDERQNGENGGQSDNEATAARVTGSTWRPRGIHNIVSVGPHLSD